MHSAHMADAMGKETSVQKEWIDLLREMVLKTPVVLIFLLLQDSVLS